MNFLGVGDDGQGPALYASPVPGTGAADLGRWDGSTWIAQGLSGEARALINFDDGSGPALYAGRVYPGGVLRWNGTGWNSLGGGLSVSNPYAAVYVHAFAIFDDGTGPALYVAGYFTSAGGVPANGIAKWDGNTWSALGSGLTSLVGPLPVVRALAVFDDGNGPALYAAGHFSHAGGQPIPMVARWDGSGWSALGNGVPVTSAWQLAWALTVFDDGQGPALYVVTDTVHRWDGLTWSSIGASGGTTPLVVFDDGTGPALHKRGFTMSNAQGGGGTVSVDRWTGGAWIPVGGAFALNPGPQFCGVWGLPQCPGTPNLWALTVFDDGSGPALYGGGKFDAVGGLPGSEVARLSCGTTVSMHMTQPGGPGTPIWIHNSNLTTGRECFNVFSPEPCPGGPGGGPYLGLCSSYPQILLDQVLMPLGVGLTHFVAPADHLSWGPYLLPPLTIEGVCFDLAGASFGSVSPVASLTIY